LGGTIKIAEEMGKNLTEDDVLKLIINELKTIEGKIHFGLSLYSGPPQNHSSVGAIHEFSLQAWGKKIKKILKDQNRSVRYVENREPILSSVTVEKNGLTKRGREFLIQVATYGSEGPLAPTDRCFSLAKTTAVQPFEEWGKRDFGRPGRDDKSGMLPPKLATMMINLLGRGVGAIHELPLENAPGVLLDPFCGSGTILTEAHRLGYTNLIGTDISEKAVEDTKKNVEWTKNNEHALQNTEQFSIKIVPSASKNLSQTILACSVDGIVTEPFLGKPRTGRESRAE
jgi:tRNA G10  N-methylase Trm11